MEVVGKLLKESAEKQGYFTEKTLCLLVRNALYTIMNTTEDCWEILSKLFTITHDYLSALQPKEYVLVFSYRND